MGRAIVRNPEGLLFDEPLSNLDAKLRVDMRSKSRSCIRSCASPASMSPTTRSEAMTLSDRMLVMNSGIIEQVGTPKEVCERPASLFVANFISTPGDEPVLPRGAPGSR